MPPRNVVPKPLQRPHPPMWVACSRRETIQFAARNGIGALSFSFVEPEDAGKWVSEYYELIDVGGVRAGGLRRQPERGRGAADDAPRGRGHGDRARHRRRALLRLLARALLRHGHPPAGPHERLGGVPREPRRNRLRAPHRDTGRRPAGGEDHGGGPRLAARGDRNAGPGDRPPAPLRGRGRGPGHLRAPGRPQPARAHLRLDRALRQARGAALRRGPRGARADQGRGASPQPSSARWPGARPRARLPPGYAIDEPAELERARPAPRVPVACASARRSWAPRCAGRSSDRRRS